MPHIQDIPKIHYGPCISIIASFEPKMGGKKELLQKLKLIADNIEHAILDNYPEESVMIMMQKLHNILRTLNYDTHKKSIAIFASPVFEKVFYLDMPVEEKVRINATFNIEDLISFKKQFQKYLLLLLSVEEILIYQGDSNELTKILNDTVYPMYHNMPQKEGDFPDLSGQKEIIIDKFFHHIDNSLSIILKNYDFPLFIMGDSKIIDQFKSISKNRNAVIEYIEAEYKKLSTGKLKEIMGSHIADWNKILQKNLLNKIEDARTKKKLVSGITDVWSQAQTGNTKLLLVEKNYHFNDSNVDSMIYKAIRSNSNFSFIENTIDKIIENVLENGGDVEIVDTDFLKEYDRLALIKY